MRYEIEQAMQDVVRLTAERVTLQAECAQVAGDRDALRAALAEVAQDLECDWFDDIDPDEPRSCVEIAAAMDDDAWALDFLPTQPRPTQPCRACRYRLLTQ